jgi:hypothetical protein
MFGKFDIETNYRLICREKCFKRMFGYKIGLS